MTKFSNFAEKVEEALDSLFSALESVISELCSLNEDFASAKRKSVDTQTSYYQNRQTLTAPTESMGRNAMEFDYR